MRKNFFYIYFLLLLNLHSQTLWDEETPFFFRKENREVGGGAGVLSMGSIIYLTFSSDILNREDRKDFFKRSREEGAMGSGIGEGYRARNLLPIFFPFLPKFEHNISSEATPNILRKAKEAAGIAATVINYDVTNKTYWVRANRILRVNTRNWEGIHLRGRIKASALSEEGEVRLDQVADLLIEYKTTPFSIELGEGDFKDLDRIISNGVIGSNGSAEEYLRELSFELGDKKKREIYIRYLNWILKEAF